MTRIRKDEDTHKESSLVQIDVDNPWDDRRDALGRRRISLSKVEREIIEQRQLAGKALKLMLEKGLDLPAIAEKLKMPLDITSKMALSGEYGDLREALVQRAVEKYLDVGKGRKRKELAKELGISVQQLIYLSNSEDFKQAYNEYFGVITSSPEIKAVQLQIVQELLPQAFVALRALLAVAPPTVKLNAAKEVIRLSGVQPVQAQSDDSAEWKKFMDENKITISVEKKYEQALENAGVVEGVIVTDRSGSDDDIPNIDQSPDSEDETQLSESAPHQNGSELRPDQSHIDGSSYRAP